MGWVTNTLRSSSGKLRVSDILIFVYYFTEVSKLFVRGIKVVTWLICINYLKSFAQWETILAATYSNDVCKCI